MNLYLLVVGFDLDVLVCMCCECWLDCVIWLCLFNMIQYVDWLCVVIVVGFDLIFMWQVYLFWYLQCVLCMLELCCDLWWDFKLFDVILLMFVLYDGFIDVDFVQVEQLYVQFYFDKYFVLNLCYMVVFLCVWYVVWLLECVGFCDVYGVLCVVVGVFG